jgi:hypothetical protein
MLGIDFLIGFGIGMLISAGVVTLYYFAESDVRRVFYGLKHRI